MVGRGRSADTAEKGRVMGVAATAAALKNFWLGVLGGATPTPPAANRPLPRNACCCCWGGGGGACKWALEVGVAR